MLPPPPQAIWNSLSHLFKVILVLSSSYLIIWDKLEPLSYDLQCTCQCYQSVLYCCVLLEQLICFLYYSDFSEIHISILTQLVLVCHDLLYYLTLRMLLLQNGIFPKIPWHNLFIWCPNWTLFWGAFINASIHLDNILR